MFTWVLVIGGFIIYFAIGFIISILWIKFAAKRKLVPYYKIGRRVEKSNNFHMSVGGCSPTYIMTVRDCAKLDHIKSLAFIIWPAFLFCVAVVIIIYGLLKLGNYLEKIYFTIVSKFI